MDYEVASRREVGLRSVVGYVVVVAAGIVGLTFGAPATAAERWAVIALLAAIAVLQARPPGRGRTSWRIHLHLAIHGGLVAALMFLQPGWTMYPVLFMTPIAWAIFLLPARQGTYWTVAYAVTTASSFAWGTSLGEGLMALFLYSALYALVGAFANTLARAEAARRNSQSLLAELREAHEQLREYSLRAEELAVVEERNRLAREMHDTLGHRLTVAAVQLDAAERLCPTDSARAAAMVSTAREEVREALGELRSAVAALRAPVEADLRLRSALHRLISHFEKATGLTVHQVLPNEMPSLPDAYRLALFRAAQEALTNVQKHAEARQAWLVLAVGDEAVSLLVSDDGKGIAPARTGFGLQGLRERAAQLGGDLHVEPRAGGGTQLSFRLPLPSAQA